MRALQPAVFNQLIANHVHGHEDFCGDASIVDQFNLRFAVFNNLMTNSLLEKKTTSRFHKIPVAGLSEASPVMRRKCRHACDSMPPSIDGNVQGDCPRSLLEGVCEPWALLTDLLDPHLEERHCMVCV